MDIKQIALPHMTLAEMDIHAGGDAKRTIRIGDNPVNCVATVSGKNHVEIAAAMVRAGNSHQHLLATLMQIGVMCRVNKLDQAILRLVDDAIAKATAPDLLPIHTKSEDAYLAALKAGAL